jgi:hypothetical protein
MPHEDVTLVAHNVTWTFWDGVNNPRTATFDPQTGWCWDTIALTPLQYRVWDDQLGPHDPAFEPCYEGEFRGSTPLPVTFKPSRTFRLAKPISSDTVALLAPAAQASLWGTSSPLFQLPVMTFEFMRWDPNQGVFLPRTRYTFDDAVMVQWRIETVGGRVQEVIEFDNTLDQFPAAGSVEVEGVQPVAWGN